MSFKHPSLTSVTVLFVPSVIPPKPLKQVARDCDLAASCKEFLFQHFFQEVIVVVATVTILVNPPAMLLYVYDRDVSQAVSQVRQYKSFLQKGSIQFAVRKGAMAVEAIDCTDCSSEPAFASSATSASGQKRDVHVVCRWKFGPSEVSNRTALHQDENSDFLLPVPSLSIICLAEACCCE